MKRESISKDHYSSIINSANKEQNSKQLNTDATPFVLNKPFKTQDSELNDNLQTKLELPAESNQEIDQSTNQKINEMARLEARKRQDHLEQTDLESVEHDSGQSELESDESEDSENTNDELEDEEEDEDKDYDDNELDKDYRNLKHKTNNNYYYLPKQPTTKSISNLMTSAQIIASQQTAKIPVPYSLTTNQTPANSILPHYMSNHLINSAANSDKLSITADNHRLSKKAKELRKHEFKREYQRLDNQPYTMHSPSQTTSNHNSNHHLTTNVKSGCNL